MIENKLEPTFGDITWNKATWSDKEWSEKGEEWSKNWGSSESQWVTTILPRIHSFFPEKLALKKALHANQLPTLLFSFIPRNSILEIAPGFGRWTKFLLSYPYRSYCGIDLAFPCIAHCKKKFKQYRNCRFFMNDGLSLQFAKYQKYDFIFSFDSLVHVGLDVLEAYIQQIMKNLLTPNGVCFIHHSNFKMTLAESLATLDENIHYRNPDVSAADVSQLVQKYEGKIIYQEAITWGGSPLSDCLTLFAHNSSPYNEKGLFYNRNFDNEAAYSREILNNYCMMTS